MEGLSKYSCSSFSEVEALIATGSRNRSIASTLMNSTSSRAHTIVRMEIKQVTLQEEGGTLEIDSVISLVDLAGSERVGKTGASGDRLKEGNKINLSLHVLGMVIYDLAKKSTDKNSISVTPYRDSVLTRIL